jgi:UDP-N-acetylglucosamine 3-dehydrogenase
MSNMGVILDLVIPDVDFIRHISGQEIVKINYEKHLIKNGLDGDAIILLWVGNALSSVNVRWTLLQKIGKMRTDDENGVITLDYINQDIELFKETTTHGYIGHFSNLFLDHSTRTIEKPIINKREPLKEELAHFIRCIKRGTEPLVTISEALKKLVKIVMVNLTMNAQRLILMQHEHQRGDFYSLRHSVFVFSFQFNADARETRSIVDPHLPVSRAVIHPTDQYKN